MKRVWDKSGRRIFLCALSLFFITSTGAQIITRYAGNGSVGYSGNGGPATSAKLATPSDVATDKAGSVYIADRDNNVIRVVNSAGIISNFAGSGAMGYAGDGGPATAATFYFPDRIAFDHAGNLYVVDQIGAAIRKVDVNGIITTLVNNYGTQGFSGDGGLLRKAQLHGITGIAFDKADNMYIADYYNQRIRKVNTAGIIITYAGTGVAGYSGDGGPAIGARLNHPCGLTFDSADNLYVSDATNSCVRKITPSGIISTYAGNGTYGYSGDGGPANLAQMHGVLGCAMDKAGNLYIEDESNYAIRKVSPTGIITTFAGNGTQGYSGDGGPATAAQIFDLRGISVDNIGNVYIVDRMGKNVVRKISAGSACTNDLFLKTYYRANAESWASDFATTAGGDLIAGGYLSDTANHANLSDAVLMKIASDGVKVWEKNFFLPGSQGIDHVVSLADGNFLATGYDWFANGSVSIFLLKFNTDGNVLWKRTYQYTIGVNFRITQVKEDADGSLYATAYYIEDGLSFHDRVLFLKFSSAGSLLFAKSYKPPGQINVTSPQDFIIKNGFSYIAGQYHSYTNYQGALWKVNNANGNLEWVRNYGYQNGGTEFFQIFPFDKDRLCLIGEDVGNGTNRNVMMICDTTGALHAANALVNSSYRVSGRAVMDSSGTLTWFSRVTSNPAKPGNLAVAHLHPVNGVQWVHEFTQLANNPHVNTVRYANDSSVLFLGNHTRADGRYEVFAGKLSKDGRLACDPIDQSYDFENGNAFVGIVDYTTTDKTFTEIQRDWVEAAPQITLTDTLCYYHDACSQLKLQGPPRVCAGDTVRIRIQKNCSLIPTFDFDGRLLRFIASADTIATFVALDSGTTVVNGRIDLSCSFLKDSFSLVIHKRPGPVDLGPDRLLCPGNTLLLNAHMGYATYQWQDGSADSTFQVTVPGLYHVTATDGCGGVFQDSVVMASAPPIPFTAGPDRTKCNGDTLHLSAPAGFLNYTWSNNYNITSLSAQSVVVNPLVDTAYYVKAEKTTGCFAYDTVRIRVLISPAIDLGRDTSLCFGDSIVLNAGKGFQSYAWNNGSTDQSFTAKATGVYSVTGTTPEGCRSIDTLRVLQVYPLPLVQLDKTPALCQGETRTLDAGGFVSYRWQDGSTTKTFTVKDTGQYFVTVTDQNGCNGHDRTVITTIYPLPQDFLPADTSICAYEKLELKPLSTYRMYWWSTGGVSPSLTVTQPDLYWLEVQDDNNCKGKDFINVAAKDCLSGFYVPSAFSPNSDGKNDVFRPLLFGTVRQYTFTIYNRWGQMVFQTSALGKGWNGKVAGVLQPTSMFVWTCRYQLEGGAVKTEKGTVTLIK